MAVSTFLSAPPAAAAVPWRDGDGLYRPGGAATVNIALHCRNKIFEYFQKNAPLQRFSHVFAGGRISFRRGHFNKYNKHYI